MRDNDPSIINIVCDTAPKLPNLLKMLVWAQKRLDEKAIYPRINNLQTAELISPDLDN